MISNVQIVWKSLRNALNFRSILFCAIGKLRVVNFAAGGVETLADTALMMQLGAEW